MRFKYFITLCILLCYVHITAAQSMDFDFTVISNTMTIDNQEVQQNTSFVKDGSSLVFNQTIGASHIQRFFSINTISGYWDVENAIGNLIFDISHENFTANLTLTGTSNGVVISLVVPQMNQSVDTFTFTDCTLNY